MLPVDSMGFRVSLVISSDSIYRTENGLSSPHFKSSEHASRYKQLFLLFHTEIQMIALNNHLFALGGLTPQGFTHSVERYDLTTNEWEYAAPLSEPRYRHAACVTSRGKVNFELGRQIKNFLNFLKDLLHTSFFY